GLSGVAFCMRWRSSACACAAASGAGWAKAALPARVRPRAVVISAARMLMLLPARVVRGSWFVTSDSWFWFAARRSSIRQSERLENGFGRDVGCRARRPSPVHGSAASVSEVVLREAYAETPRRVGIAERTATADVPEGHRRG